MHHQHMTHDWPLVVLSFLVALLASYTALDMGTRLRRAADRARLFWLGASAIVLGGGIWSMHFIAMLAMDAGTPVAFDFDLTALSLFTAIAIVALGFHLVTRPKPSIVRQILAGTIVGIGVAAMHYTGMGALILDGTVHYNALGVAASIVVAVVAATAALWLTLNLTKPWHRAAAALVMAIAVCGMHYTAMLATTIDMSMRASIVVDPMSRMLLAAAVAVGIFLILCLAMVCVFADRRFEALAEREAEGLREANKALTDSQSAIRNLLDNADQAFLTIDADLVVGAQFSAACETMLEGLPAGKSIVALLYREASDQSRSTQATLQSVFCNSSDLARELKLELLPQEFELDGRFLRAGYKFLGETRHLMLILTDITQTKLLSQEVERERKRLEMIVLAITESEAFAALVNDYQRFLDSELDDLLGRIDGPDALSELHRCLHTFKGLLAQYSFPLSPAALHDYESELASNPAWSVRAARAALGPHLLRAALEQDLASVRNALGANLELTGRRARLSPMQLRTLEQLARTALAAGSDSAAAPALRLLAHTLAKLSMLDVKAALLVHGRGATSLAARLEKDIAPIEVHGEDVALPERCGDFLRSLVHVFRNAIDHGLEGPEERLQAGKPSQGSIRCDISDHGDWVEILITDDGQGIDRASLENKLAATHGHLKAARASLTELVFSEGLSSRETPSDISGRGIGLAAVKAELDRLGGGVSVETEAGAGTRFRFRVPTTELSVQDVVTAERIAV